MISFTIRCADGHRFEGWFRDNAAYDGQVAAGALACPVCGSTAVEKAPMAPAIARHRGRAEAAPSTPPTAGDMATAPNGEKSVQMGSQPTPDQTPRIPARSRERLAELMGAWRAEMKRIRAHVEENADYVGDRFADEALAIHHGEKEGRDIYGEATEAETERLTEEGVSFARIPWLPKDN
ncbi:MAG: DUF1178 family protein [Azospirillaceae bacterium]